MKRFASLLDRLSTSPSRNAKIKLIADYLSDASDPERGYALAVLTGDLSFDQAKPRMIRQLIAERTDPVLFAMSHDYVGDLSETVALLWPATSSSSSSEAPSPELPTVVETLQSLPAQQVAGTLARWLDGLDETGRWALLKLMTGALRVGVSARLAKTAAAAMGGRDADEIEEIWPDLAPPYTSLFAWLEGRGLRPEVSGLSFKSPMLAHPLDESVLATLDLAGYGVEWKWDGIRVQAIGVGGSAPSVRIFSRTGDDITGAFTDVARELQIDGAVIDGELLVISEGRVQPFNALQQRLNRKTVSATLMADFPAHIRAYDLLALDGRDLRETPYAERRQRLEAFVQTHRGSRLDLSPRVMVASARDIAQARANPSQFCGGVDSDAIEGVMIKRLDSTYLPGRPRGLWWKWKREPMVVDAVLMYAQRGHGKRSSYYSDYTFGVWRDGVLVPVGKAYFGFTDEELKEIDRFVRNNTVNRFGPVREVRHEAGHGLVFEVAFEGLNRSNRNKSGLAMRFPRIARIRWDKKPVDADGIETLERMVV